MKRALLAGIELEYEVYGDGAPVVLIHPGIFAKWFDPLIRESSLAGRNPFCTITALDAQAAAAWQVPSVLRTTPGMHGC